MYNGIIKGSRTMDAATMVALLGVAEQNLPLVREQLGNYYGWILMGIGVAFIFLRKITTKPLK